MRFAPSLMFAAALVGAPLVSYAATTTGDITHIDRASNSLVLDNGATFHAPKAANLSRFKVGERVSVAYVMRHGKLDAVAVRPRSSNSNDRGLNANFGG